MAEGEEKVNETKDAAVVSDPQPVQKVTYTFDDSIVGSSRREFAFLHNLGTRHVLVSLRTIAGNTKALKTFSQDDNVMLITLADQYKTFEEGDTLIALG